MRDFVRTILVLCVYNIAAVFGTLYYKLGWFDDLFPPIHVTPLEEPLVFSVTDCARTCSGFNGICKSFFYIDSTPPVCQLQSVLWNSTISLDSKPDSRYYTEQAAPYYPFACPTPLEYTSVTLSDGTLFTYRFYESVSYNQTEALAFCAGEEARLAQITTQAKLEMVYQIRNDCLAYQPVWIDGNNLDATDYTDSTQWSTNNMNASDFTDLTLWKTSSSVPINPSFWYWTQPNEFATAHCLYLYRLDDGYNTLADYSCTILCVPLCEK